MQASVLFDVAALIRANAESGGRVAAHYPFEQAAAEIKAEADCISAEIFSYGKKTRAEVIKRSVALPCEDAGRIRRYYDGVPDVTDGLNAIRYTSRDMEHRILNMTKVCLLGAQHLWIDSVRVSSCV